MKKTLSIILALVFVLSMCTFTFAEEAEKEILPGLINQVGDWSAVEGGYKANSVSGMIVLDQQMGAGVFEATVKRGTEKVNDTAIYLRGTGFDTLENFDNIYTKTTGLRVLFNDSNGQIGFYNNYKNAWCGGPNIDGATGADYTKFPYDTWLYNVPYGEEYALRIEFGTGGIRVIVNDKVVVENVDFADKQATTTNTDIKCPMGTQIAIQSYDDTFTNFKFTPWDASNDADWTSDCDSLTNVAGKQGFAYNANVAAPAGSTVSFDVTADNFKEGTGNNGFFFGGDHLYAANNAEKNSAVGKG
ncbi:MAG: hypothetical protein IJZ03_00195, partial [Clostridia bacterium]|nr:hypothetical protein [Clostridia bacterium]